LVVAWLFASCTAATLAHGLIELSGDAGFGGTYVEYGHAAAGSVAISALLLAGVALLMVSLRSLSDARAVASILTLFRDLGSMQPPAACAAVTFGGFSILIGMEYGEQACAFGRVLGLGAALGGNGVAGLTITVVVSAFVALVGLRSAHAFVRGAIVAAGTLARWIAAKTTPPADCAAIVRLTPLGCRTDARALLACCFGLRAPPQAG
jgi:hypothetical protein